MKCEGDDEKIDTTTGENEAVAAVKFEKGEGEREGKERRERGRLQKM